MHEAPIPALMRYEQKAGGAVGAEVCPSRLTAPALRPFLLVPLPATVVTSPVATTTRRMLWLM